MLSPGVLRKALSGHLGLHRVTTIQKAFKSKEIKRGEITNDKYSKLSQKFHLLEHSVTLEDNHGDENNENKKVEQTIYQTAFRSILVLATYFGIGLLALVFLDGNMNFFDIVYFLVITFTTIGYGDISPSNKYSKLFVCLYTVCGLLLFSTALSGMIRYWSSQQEKRYRKQVLDRINEEDYLNDPYEDDDGDDVEEEEEEEEGDNDSDEEGEEGKIHIEGGDDVPPIDTHSQQQMEMEMGTTQKRKGGGRLDHQPQHMHMHMGQATLSEMTINIYDMKDKVSRYFVEKLDIPPFAVPIIKDLLRSIFHIFLNVSFGTLCYYLLQDGDNANFIDALYLTVTTVTTVGYGDVVPSSTAAKVFTVIYVCVGTLFTAKCVMKFNQAITNYQKQ
jgi:hypothetical protein